MEDTNMESWFDIAKEAIVKFLKPTFWICITVFLVIVTIRLALFGVNLDFSEFSFSDLLALILALFAIALSAAFYFEATKSSGKFYDRIYDFIKDTSNSIGRMDERFSERLSNIDDRVKNFSFTPEELQEKYKQAEDEQEKASKELNDVKEEYEKIIDELTVKANLEEEEKEIIKKQFDKLKIEREKILNKLRLIEDEKENYRLELGSIKNDETFLYGKPILKSGGESLNKILSVLIINDKRMVNAVNKGDMFGANEIWKNYIFGSLVDDKISMLLKYNIIDNEGNLTNTGFKMLQKIYINHLTNAIDL